MRLHCECAICPGPIFGTPRRASTGSGKLHSFHYLVNGATFGGRLDLPAFGPLSYLQPGVPSGTLSPAITHTSKIYDGMRSEYWIYVPAQYDPKTPAALMVFQDGGGYLDRKGNNPALNVVDNLIAQKKIPVMICVFINPGDISDSPGTPTHSFVRGVLGEMAPHPQGLHAQHAVRHGQRPLCPLSAR